MQKEFMEAMRGNVSAKTYRTARPAAHRPNSDVRILQPGTIPAPPEGGLIVIDDESFQIGLEMAAENPVMIQTPGLSKRVEDFDEAMKILARQIERNSWAIMYPMREPVKVPYVSKIPPSTLVGPQIPMVKVIDEKTFDEAMDLINQGSIDIVIGNKRHNDIIDFDEAAELITTALIYGRKPVVYGRIKGASDSIGNRILALKHMHNQAGRTLRAYAISYVNEPSKVAGYALGLNVDEAQQQLAALIHSDSKIVHMSTTAREISLDEYEKARQDTQDDIDFGNKEHQISTTAINLVGK